MPAPLAALFAVALVQALVWSFVVPALQGPDEVGHFSYTQRIWERPSLPWHPEGGQTARGKGAYSTEINTAEVYAGLAMLFGNASARPLWTEPDEDIWRREEDRLTQRDREDGDFTAALKNPPLYYLYATVPYAAASGGSVFDRVYLIRLANIPLLLALLGFTWLLAGELLGRRRWLQFAAAAPVALHPQLANLGATVNPDLMLAAGWAAALWLIVGVLRRGPEPRLVLGLAALCVAIGFTHPRGIPIVVPALLAVALGAGRRRLAAGMGAAVLGGVTAAAAWGTGSAREFWSYVWQFYLPRAPGQQDAIGPDFWDFREVFVDRFFGTLASLEIEPPEGLTTALLWASLAGLALLAVLLARHRHRLDATALVLGAAAIALMLGLHLGAYRAMLTVPADPVVTGRYLLPLLPLYGCAIALVARLLPARAGPVFAGVVIGAAVALQMLSAGMLLERFYA